MSKPDCAPARPIPTGILVRDVEFPCKQERPSPTPIVPRLTAPPARRSPWLLVVSAGSMAWALVVMTIALRAGGKENERPQPLAQEPPVLLAAATPAPVAAPKPLVAPKDDGQFDEAFAPRVEPSLPHRLLPLPLEEPSLWEITPEPPAGPEPPAKPSVVAEPKRPKKDIDLKVFANCASIGTDILFVKDPPEAFRRAKAENKLVYMMHLSGNLEDKDFT
jgi:hypothetical protein